MNESTDTSEPSERCRPGGRFGTNPELDGVARQWGGSWGRFLFPAFWLVYLSQTVDGVSKHAHGAGAVVGYVIVAAFAVTYLAALNQGWWKRADPAFWVLYALGFGLTGAELFFAHQDALAFLIYLAVLTVAARLRISSAIIVALVLVEALVPKYVFDHKASIDWGDALTLALVSIAMWGFFHIIESNIELSAARAEVARLAAENERTRIARDLHDLLGHSLTTITVKAGLARRLVARDDMERAGQEIAEVEELTRRTLGEVRSAVAGYRDVTLGGELASAHEVLRAAGIEASLPGAIDIVDAEAAPVFGWVVREGVTNIVRHSRATHCAITVGPRWIEIADDGRGGSAGAGNGLTGLRERLTAVGGTVEAGGSAQGWRLRAQLAGVGADRDAAVLPA